MAGVVKDPLLESLGVAEVEIKKCFCMNCPSDGKLYPVTRRCRICTFLCCPRCMKDRVCILCLRNARLPGNRGYDPSKSAGQGKAPLTAPDNPINERRKDFKGFSRGRRA